jgi:hypothetical protein
MANRDVTTLSELFTAAPAGPAQAMSYRQGVIVEFDPLTGANKINVGGTVLEDLPILNTTEALLLTPGAVVGIMVVGSTWAILGRLAIPGTPDAASALTAVRTFSDSVVTSESTTSTTYTDLATVGPAVADVLIGASGRALVTVSCEIRSVAAAGSAISTGAGFMNFDIAGATTLSPLDPWAALGWIRYDESAASTKAIDIRVAASRQTLLTGLNPGAHTFTALYKAGSSSNAATFLGRNITVIPL